MLKVCHTMLLITFTGGHCLAITPSPVCAFAQAFELTLDIDRLIREVDHDRWAAGFATCMGLVSSAASAGGMVS